MKTITRVPARLGLGGGGTDIPDYFNKHGGAVLNCTINQYVYCMISEEPKKGFCSSYDKGIIEFNEDSNQKLILHWAAKKYFGDVYGVSFSKISITTFTDIPEGSGLGTSSALVVAIVKSISEHFNLNFDKAKLVETSYHIERVMCKLSGGFQDYIAAVYGGINFTEFFHKNKYLVTPLRISDSNKAQFENQTTLVFTGLSRASSKIISDQQKSFNDHQKLLHMHEVKEFSLELKHAFITSDFFGFRTIFKKSWEAKKATSASVSNNLIDNLELELMQNGADALKISGAGGGGFMMVLTSSENSLKLRNFVKNKYEYRTFTIVETGAFSWKET